jgi:NMD protein affecting ribosome stability and mRNA decay
MMSNQCVCCGAELPEGYGNVCKDCEAAAKKLNPVEAVKKRISFSYVDNPSIHIKNSYLITSAEDIMDVLEYIHSLDEYKKLQAAGYTRTIEGECIEWRGHNTLYRLGFKRSRTGSVDINQNEPKWRRLIYAILSIF